MSSNDSGLSALAVDLITVGIEGTVRFVLHVGPGDHRDVLVLPRLADDREAAVTVLDAASDALYIVLRRDDARLLAVAVPEV